MVSVDVPSVYAVLVASVTVTSVFHALFSVAVTVALLTRPATARSQIVAGLTLSVVVARCCAGSSVPYLSAGYWLAEPKCQGSSPVLSRSRSRFQFA